MFASCFLPAPLRNLATAIMGPLRFSHRTGHFRSSLFRRAMGPRGQPLPWYSYPAIHFLAARDHSRRHVLEFGGGQSTLWWAQRAASVTTLEGDARWAARLRARAPGTVRVHEARMDDARTNVADVERLLLEFGRERYDVIVIDGLYRGELVDLARRHLAPDGVLVGDDSEGYGFHEAFRSTDLMRVDFYGHAPGVWKEHCTSLWFGPEADLLRPAHPIVRDAPTTASVPALRGAVGREVIGAAVQADEGTLVGSL